MNATVSKCALILVNSRRKYCKFAESFKIKHWYIDENEKEGGKCQMFECQVLYPHKYTFGAGRG